MALDYDKLMAWPFPVVKREYAADDAIRFARGFGAGSSASMAQADQPFLRQNDSRALPMIAVPLCDGEFWQQHPSTGIVWQQIIHAEEALTMHRPLPVAGMVAISQRIEAIYDRGREKGAVMLQKQFLHDSAGALLATIDVTTILRGNGGFGGKPWPAVRVALPADHPADRVLELHSAAEADAIFRLSADLAVASNAPRGKSMMRGVGCFGTAGRAALALACGNEPERLRRLGVRYVGPMYTDERLRVELWDLAPGRAVFRMSAPERDTMVLDNCFVDFGEAS